MFHRGENSVFERRYVEFPFGLTEPGYVWADEVHQHDQFFVFDKVVKLGFPFSFLPNPAGKRTVDGNGEVYSL